MCVVINFVFRIYPAREVLILGWEGLHYTVYCTTYELYHYREIHDNSSSYDHQEVTMHHAFQCQRQGFILGCFCGHSLYDVALEDQAFM